MTRTCSFRPPTCNPHYSLRRRLLLGACLAVQALWLCAGAAPVFAAPATNVERIRQSELEQARIQAQTQHLAGELDAILSEFKDAGLGNGEDARVLNAIRAHLNRLSAEDMAKVVELFQDARTTGGLQDVAGAFGKQKEIVVHLRQILLAYQRQEDVYELSLLFGKLADRQNTNLKLAKRLVRATAGKGSFDENQGLNLSVQASEQGALKGETAGLLDKLKTLISEVDPESSARLKQSLDQADQAKLIDLLGSAADDLKNASVYHAATTEVQGRDALRELSRLVAPPLDTIELLRHAAEEIQRAILAQKAIAPKTAGLSEARDETSIEFGFEMEDLEADLVDQTAGIRKDIDNSAPDAASELGVAIDTMQDVRSAMVKRTKEPSLAGQRQAITHLEAARSMVLARLMKEQQKAESKDTLSTLKELRDKVEALKHEEEGLKRDTVQATATPARQQLAPKQGLLQKAAQDLQAEAAPQSTPAADAIGQAAREMADADESLKKGDDAQQTAKPEQRAIDQLATAEKALDDEIKKLEQAEKDLAQLEETREKLVQLIKLETGVELKTAKAQAAQQKSQPDASADAKPVAAEQGDVADKTAQLATELPDAAQDAAAPLQAAQGEMKNAEAKLDKNKAEQARPPEHQALAELQRAKDALDQKEAELAQELGEPDPNADANSKLGQAIADAQADTGQAEQAARAGHLGPAGKLAETARKLAAAAAQASPPPSVSQPLAKAEEALADAGAQAEAGNAEGAEAGADKAEAALAEAAAALALTGNGTPVASAQGQGQEKGQGQEPGHGPGHSAQESRTQGRGDRMNTHVSAGDHGARADVRTPGQFIGLPPRDRKAIIQSEQEKVPAEYAPFVEQYLRNLADPENNQHGDGGQKQ